MLQLSTFAQSYDYSTVYNSLNTTSTSSSSSSLPTGLLVGIIVGCVVLAAISIAAMWRIFTKAGKPGWAAIVPIYNLIVLLQVIGRPVWWILLYLLAAIPFVGFIVALVVQIIVANDLAKSFGKSTGYTVLLVLLPIIGYPMLAWGKATYQGPAALHRAGAGTPPPAAPTDSGKPAATPEA